MVALQLQRSSHLTRQETFSIVAARSMFRMIYNKSEHNDRKKASLKRSLSKLVDKMEKDGMNHQVTAKREKEALWLYKNKLHEESSETQCCIDYEPERVEDLDPNSISTREISLATIRKLEKKSFLDTNGSIVLTFFQKMEEDGKHFQELRRKKQAKKNKRSMKQNDKKDKKHKRQK